MAFNMEDVKKFPSGWVCPSETQKLTGNEFLVKCPYDMSHKVLSSKFSVHLRRCRTNYELQKGKEGGTPSLASCKYNVEHKVYQPELPYHEHICADKMLLLLEEIYIENQVSLEDICGLPSVQNGKQNGDTSRGERGGASSEFREVGASSNGISAKNSDPTEAVSKIILQSLIGRVADGSALKEVNSLTNRLIKMVMDRPSKTVGEGGLRVAPQTSQEKQLDNVTLTKRKSRQVDEIPLNKISQTLCPDYIGPKYVEPEPDDDPNTISQTLDPYSFGYIHRRGRIITRREYLARNLTRAHTYKPVNEDDWSIDNSPATEKFDWLEKQHNLKGPSRIFPPGLTKSQRKKFVEDNTIRLMCEEGIFVDEEGEEDGKQPSTSEGPNKRGKK